MRAERRQAVGTHLATLLGTGLILLFFSEFLFLNEGPVTTVVGHLEQGRAGHLVAALAEFVAFYVLFAYVLLAGLQWCQVRTLTDLLLLGALVGWAIEGIVIPLVYEAVPLSLLWPSVGWHALVDVMLGWYLLRRLLRRARWGTALLAFAGLGLAWGAWATWLWIDPDGPPPLEPTAFAAYAATTSLLWIGGLVLLDHAGTTAFRVHRWEARLWLVVCGAGALLMAASAWPWSLAIIPAVWLTIRALRRPTGGEARELVTDLADPPPWPVYLTTIATPVTAAGTYAVLHAAGRGVPSTDVVLVLVLVGGLWLIAAWRRALPRRATSVPGPPPTG